MSFVIHLQKDGYGMKFVILKRPLFREITVHCLSEENIVCILRVKE
jgi:hypothetical protein